MKRAFLCLAVALVLSSCGSEQTPAPLGSATSSSSSYVGEQFPKIELTNFRTEVKSTSLEQTRGKVVNLWASWCEPCRREFPLMAQSPSARDIVAINVNDLAQSNEGKTQADEMVALGDDSLSVWIDAKNVLPTQLALVGLPITVAVNREGIVVDSHIGELHQDSLDRLLKAAQQ